MHRVQVPLLFYEGIRDSCPRRLSPAMKIRRSRSIFRLSLLPPYPLSLSPLHLARPSFLIGKNPIIYPGSGQIRPARWIFFNKKGRMQPSEPETQPIRWKFSNQDSGITLCIHSDWILSNEEWGSGEQTRLGRGAGHSAPRRHFAGAMRRRGAGNGPAPGGATLHPRACGR